MKSPKIPSRSRTFSPAEKKSRRGLRFLATGALVAALASVASAQDRMSNDLFEMRLNQVGITSLKRVNDSFDTEYVRGRALGDISIRFRMGNGKWQETSASRMPDRLPQEPPSSGAGRERRMTFFERYYLYSEDYNDHYADLKLTTRFRLEGDALIWTLRLNNLADRPLTIGDLALPLPFNTSAWWNKTEMYTKRLIPHLFISGHGSFAFWMRPNGVGPYLVMTPLATCPPFESPKGFRPAKLEYGNERAVYIHSAATGPEDVEQGGNWRQPFTSLPLPPRSSPGSEVAYGFKFRWAKDYDEVRQILFEEGLIDVQVVPGMTVPTDLEALVALRTREPIRSIVPEHPDRTRIEDLGSKANNSRLYRVRFSRLGENSLTVNYGDNRSMLLEFFACEPLGTLIKKRAAHLVGRQQIRDPQKWYDGLFSDWDMRSKILRSPDDLDGLKDFWVACDDPGSCKAPYVAAKNVSFPDAREVEAVEYYIKNYVWGKLQRTDKETWPYGIYGIPNWKKHRESKPADRDGWIGHLWRLADYPHYIVLYLNMARIAKNDPSLVHYLNRSGYLERAFGTAKAYFTVPFETGGWSAYELCRMNEMVIPELVAELSDAGKTAEADWLRAQWERKANHYVNDGPNLLHAEYPGNPCSFESSEALARYAVLHGGDPGTTLKVRPEDAARFLEEQMTLNIALRGWIEPAYFLLGISRPGSGFYMSQMAGWSVMDYALYFSREPAKYLRLGYASYLDNWSLMNTGTAENNYGYWYPGVENDGGAGGNYVDSAFGEVQGKATARGPWFYGGEADMGFGAALRTAATVVSDDPLFGLFAYGGSLTKTADGISVVPKDGLRQRFHDIRGPHRFHMFLDRDGFAAGKGIEYRTGLEEIRFTLESRSPGRHKTGLRLSGLPPGSYEVTVGGRRAAAFRAESGRENLVTLEVGETDNAAVVIKKNQNEDTRKFGREK